MKSKQLAGSLGVLAIATLAIASSKSVIHVEGSMMVQEGGTAFAHGRMHLVDGQPSGGLDVGFERGNVVSIALTRPDSYIAVTSTAFCEGDGTMRIRRMGRMETLRGRVFVYVDDLAGFPGFADQMFIRFTDRFGNVYVRHGRIVRGDILVIPE